MIKITGTRSLQNKLSRMAFDLYYDAERILREKPELVHIADELDVLARRLERAAEKCTTS